MYGYGFSCIHMYGKYHQWWNSHIIKYLITSHVVSNKKFLVQDLPTAHKWGHNVPFVNVSDTRRGALKLPRIFQKQRSEGGHTTHNFPLLPLLLNYIQITQEYFRNKEVKEDTRFKIFLCILCCQTIFKLPKNISETRRWRRTHDS